MKKNKLNQVGNRITSLIFYDKDTIAANDDVWRVTA